MAVLSAWSIFGSGLVVVFFRDICPLARLLGSLVLEMLQERIRVLNRAQPRQSLLECRGMSFQ